MGGGGDDDDAPEASLQEYQLQMPCGGRVEGPPAAPSEHLRTCLIHAC